MGQAKATSDLNLCQKVVSICLLEGLSPAPKVAIVMSISLILASAQWYLVGTYKEI